MEKLTNGVPAVALLAALWSLPAQAVPVLCEDTSRNHTYIDSQYVSECVDAGVGNVNGNQHTDDFLIENPHLNYTGIGSASFSQSGNQGNFSLSSSLWDNWSSIAIGFKFGTGNKPDQWFVYLLQDSVSSGAWDFVNVFKRGGGLSHIQLYGVEHATVPEPGTLALFSAGLFGAALVRRMKKKQNA